MVIDEARLRRIVAEGSSRSISIAPGDIVTPAARDFLREHGFTTERPGGAQPEMPRTAIPAAGARRYIGVDGTAYAEKPEHMTHLRGNVLVGKNHPRILFRGKLDSLQARTIEAQLTARDEGRRGLSDDLGEVLAFTRDVLASEVKDEPFARDTVFGLGEQELREMSHDPRRHFGLGHPVPDADMGTCAAALNSLRTLVREAELAGVAAFVDDGGSVARPDLLRAMNRLSSAVYILLCRLLGGKYGSVDYGKR